jgi:hypothetical protein
VKSHCWLSSLSRPSSRTLSVIAASLALLGRLSDKDENGRQEYIKGDDCLASLKDIQHFLHADDVAGDVFQPAMIIEEPGKDQGKAKARRAPWELHR